MHRGEEVLCFVPLPGDVSEDVEAGDYQPRRRRRAGLARHSLPGLRRRRLQSGAYDPAGGGWLVLVSANLERLVLGCIEAKFCK